MVWTCAEPEFRLYWVKAYSSNNHYICFPFTSITCPIWIAIYHLKYFMLQSVLKLYVFPGQQQTWLKYDKKVLIFCRYQWKSKLVNVPISFHHWQRSLENTLYFIRLQMSLLNYVPFVPYVPTCPGASNYYVPT